MKTLPKLFRITLSNIVRKKLLEENIEIVTPDGHSLPLQRQNSTATHTLIINDWSFYEKPDPLKGTTLSPSKGYICRLKIPFS